MIRLVRDFRIIPVVLVAITALFVLKSFGLILDGGYTLGNAARDAEDADITRTVSQPPGGAPSVGTTTPRPPAKSQRSWAQEMFGYPDITGSVPEPKPKQEPSAKGGKATAKVDNPPPPPGAQIPVEGGRVLSPAERTILERLAERRKELEARARELEAREKLLLAAEKRLEGRVSQLKKLEAQINNSVRAKDEGEAARIKNVITMYENMKAKDAARVFDRLDMRVLVEVATAINPRRMSDIMAQMSPEAAERLTVELARRGKDRAPAELPKIEGRPGGN